MKDDSERADSAEKSKTAFDESARLKSAFLRNVNHAIRTPLNTIIGHAELLIEATEPSDRGREIRSSAEAIAEASSQLERNFRAILDLSKLHAGSFTLAPATNDWLPAESRTKTVPSIFALGVLAWLPRVPGTKQQVTNRKKMIFSNVCRRFPW